MKKQTVFVFVWGMFTCGLLQAAEPAAQAPKNREIKISAFGYFAPHIKISESVSHDQGDQVLFDRDINNNREVVNVLLPVSNHLKRVSVYKNYKTGRYYLGTTYIFPEEMKNLVSIQHCLTPEYNYLQLQFTDRHEIDRGLEVLKK